MNTLIIYSHPTRESLNGEFLNSVMKGLGENRDKNTVEILDLYGERFDPVLVFDKEKRRRDMHIDPELEKYREQLKWAERLVFIYPIFWGRPPAMVLGYIDKLFSSEFAYRYLPGKLYPEGLFKGKEAVVISTMKGPTNYIMLTLRNAHKILMKKAVFNFTGIKKVKFFEFGAMESKGGKQLKKLLKIENYFKEIHG